MAAQAQSEKLQVQARIGELCTVTSASLDFGPGIDIEEETDAEGSIEIDCATETVVERRVPSSAVLSLQGRRTLAAVGPRR